MPQVEIPLEKWTGKVQEVRLGGNGRKEIVVGGHTTLPFLHFEGTMAHRPAVAIEVWDMEPTGWPENVASAWGDALKDPGTWAKKAAEFGADIIQLRLKSADPEEGDTGAAEAKANVDKVLSAVDLPLIVLGPEIAEKDNEVAVAVSELARGQRIGLGNCEEKNHKTIAAVCIADGHVAINKSPVDINIAKQLNVLVSDVGVSLDSMLMDPTTGALGYGIEYTYSIMERLRISALQGDAMCTMPQLVTVGEECWRQKEVIVPLDAPGVPRVWGAQEERSILWEEITAVSLLHAGADIIVLRHPRSVERVKAIIDKLMTKV
jgi:acetyl-CoA decarbonylase/synthase complex subunit delta